MIIGGINPTDIPQLEIEKMDKGYQMPMGIANHSFYESIERLNQTPSKENAYYGFLVDENGNWLDSHKVGIDGPLFYFDKNDKTQLHLWILSFVRHSFVGHYKIDMK